MDDLKPWFLFFLGTVIYFLIRYSSRCDKSKEFNFLFWLQDNWPELAVTSCLDLLVMIILMDDNTNITGFLTSFLPTGVVLPAKLFIGAGCGLGLGAGVYSLFKSKLTQKKDQLLTKKEDEPIN